MRPGERAEHCAVTDRGSTYCVVISCSVYDAGASREPGAAGLSEPIPVWRTVEEQQWQPPA